MPWSSFNRPSIQLACLKSYLEEKAEIMVDGFHPYLAIAKNIGTESYIRISGSPWAGEALFAALLFPEKLADAEKLYRDCFRGQQMPPPPFQQLLEILEQSCNQWLESIDLDRYGLLGFSICFSQLLPSARAAQAPAWPEALALCS